MRRYFACVRALLATAYDDGLIRTNPAAGVRVVVADRRERRVKRLTPEQTRALLAAMPAEYADLAYLLGTTGVSYFGSPSLAPADLGLDADGRPVLTIPKSKTRSGERVIALTPHTVRRLLRRLNEAPDSGESALIFPNELGLPMDAHNYRRRVFKPATAAPECPGRRPHMLRYSLASLMAERGYSPAQIAAQLGHADGGVLALRTYIHADP